MSLIQEFPFTFLLALLGFLVGPIFISSSNPNYDFSSVVIEQPAGVFLEYIVRIFGLYAESILYGLVAGAVFGLIGLLVDFKRREVIYSYAE